VSDLSRIRLDEEEKRPQAGPGLRVVLVGATLVLGLALAVVLLLLTEDGGAEQTQYATASPPAPARVVTPSGFVTAGGYVEARRTAAIVPARGGVVAQVHARLGARVAAGDLLVEFESASLTADVEFASAQVAAARARLQLVRSGLSTEEIAGADADSEAAVAEEEDAVRERARLEAIAGAVSEQEIEQARSRERIASARAASARARAKRAHRGSRAPEVAASEAELAQATAALARAEALLEQSRLRAPFGGVIVRADVEPGEGLSPETPPRIEVADLSEVWVRVDVPEARIGGVRLGAPAEVSVDALGGEPMAAEVVEIAPLADRQSNTVEAAVRIQTPPATLRPNMSARVTIQKETGDEPAPGR